MAESPISSGMSGLGRKVAPKMVDSASQLAKADKVKSVKAKVKVSVKKKMM